MSRDCWFKIGEFWLEIGRASEQVHCIMKDEEAQGCLSGMGIKITDLNNLSVAINIITNIFYVQKLEKLSKK